MRGSSKPLFGARARRARRGLVPAAALALAVAAAPAARADLVAKINGLRKNECAARPAGAPLHVDDAAADVARELARGHKLLDALKRASYPASTATSLHVKGAQGEDGIRRELAESYCSAVGDARLSEVGVFRERREYWIVLASRKFVPPPLDPVATAARVLELVNAARGVARDCGEGHHFEAARPVTASPTLAEVALEHSRDMAEHRKLGHPGSDGSAPADRVALGLCVARHRRERRVRPADSRCGGQELAREPRPLPEHHGAALHRDGRRVRTRAGPEPEHLLDAGVRDSPLSVARRGAHIETSVQRRRAPYRREPNRCEHPPAMSGRSCNSSPASAP